jgi:hypothetical protein
MRTLLLIVVLAGCAHPVRFADRPIVWRAEDDRPVPVPHKRNDALLWEETRDAFFLPAEHAFSFDYLREAANINVLDELPDSTWWHDRRRIDERGRQRDLSDAEVMAGATAGVPPPEPPFVIAHAKNEGSAIGWVVRDARGRKFLFKADPVELPGIVTGAEVVATRLVWAAGWNVPAEWLIAVSPTDLQLAPDAWTHDQWRHQIPYRDGDLAHDLGRTASIDHHWRVLASLWIPGEIVGPFQYFGHDKSDHNDLFAHQDHRDLRGFGVWSSWVNNIDTLASNTLDSYVGAPGEGHVIHYQQDVGGSFGTFAGGQLQWWMEAEGGFEPARVFASLFTLGLYSRPWESARWRRHRAAVGAAWPELGPFESESFVPRRWQPLLDNPAFVRQTDRDRYWGAKQIAAFSEAEIRAAVSTGRYRPAAAQRLVSVLLERRQRLVSDYYSSVAAFDRFEVGDGRLCFDDMWARAGLGDAGEVRAYEERVGLQVSGGCVAIGARGGYRVIRLAVRRPGARHFGPEVAVHILTDGAGHGRVLGVAR